MEFGIGITSGFLVGMNWGFHDPLWGSFIHVHPGPILLSVAWDQDDDDDSGDEEMCPEGA